MSNRLLDALIRICSALVSVTLAEGAFRARASQGFTINLFYRNSEEIQVPLRNQGRYLRCLLLFVLTISFSAQLWAHAVLMESTPTANATVSGSEIAVTLRFNVRIDASRSRIHLGSSDGTSVNLPLTTDSGPDRLQSKVTGLKPGTYKLIWQVLASDGHMTRGEIPFTVR